jgi:type I restriction enzyme S subunit
MTNYPADWKTKRLEEVSEVIDPHPSHRAPAIDPNGIPFVGIGDVREDGIADFRRARLVSPKIFSEHAERYSLESDLIGLGRVASVGKVVKLPKGDTPYTISPTLAVISPNEISFDFLYYALQSPQIQNQLIGLKQGSGRQSVGILKLRKLLVPFPPVDKQGKIVELLEDHLSRLDAALYDVEQAKVKAAQFKVAFLRSVFSGDTGWNSIPMKQLGKWGGGGTPSKANQSFWAGGTVPWLSPKDMGPQEITHTLDKITEEACLNSTAKKIPENSVVFVVRSGILERKLPIALTKIETTLNQDMKALTFSDKVNPKFGFYSILGLEQDILRTCRKSGTTVASINTESLMNYEIKVPSLPVQAEILDYVESQLTLIDNNVPQLESVLKFGNSLRRSLLQAAFTGQLTKEVTSV